MAFGRLWAGRVFGTNTGNLFVKFDDGSQDSALTGTLRLNEPGIAIAVYKITGTFDGSLLTLEGTPEPRADGIRLGQLKATGTIQPDGSVKGEWETSIDTAGTFTLFPHSPVASNTDSGVPEPVFTARHTFGPIQINRDQIIVLAQEIQRSLPNGKVVVTFSVGTEQSRFLEDFRTLRHSSERAEVLRLFLREEEPQGTVKSISVEFGPFVNLAMAQSVSEAWALGELEKLKREIGRYERVYAAKKFGIGVNQLMAVGAIVFMPSLQRLSDRAVLAAGVFALIYAVDWLHRKYLPNAAIWLSERKDGWLERFFPSAASWFIGIMASVIATLLGAYLKGWLPLPIS
jgi:hypothetical protein